MKQHGEAIEHTPVRDTINTGITYNDYYEGLRAAHWAGGTLDELKRWIDGGYPTSFMAIVIAMYRMDTMIEQHAHSAVAADSRRRSRRH